MLSSWELLDTAKCTALWDTNKPMEHCDGCVFWCMHVFFLSFVSSCPTVQLGGGEIQSVLILVSSCKFVCSPAFTPLCSSLVLFSKGNIWLGRPPASTRIARIFRVFVHALDTRHTANYSLVCVSLFPFTHGFAADTALTHFLLFGDVHIA